MWRFVHARHTAHIIVLTPPLPLQPPLPAHRRTSPHRYVAFTREAQSLGSEALDASQLSKVPPATLRDIQVNYQDKGAPVTFRNVMYRLRALRRDQHVSAVLASRSADEMLELHRFLFEHCKDYVAKCCLPAAPRAQDAAEMTLPASLVAAQWYHGINDESVVDFVFLLGVPGPDPAASNAKGGKGNKAAAAAEVDPDAPLPVVWFNKMSVPTAAVHDVHDRLEELAMHAREQRVGDAEVARRFRALRKEVAVMLVGDDDSANIDDAAADEMLPASADNLRAVVALFDTHVGLDESHPAVCAWLRHMLVPAL
jgi:hypothetical protein